MIIALVGGGQEINRGEGGLQLWGEAIDMINREANSSTWEICASKHVVNESSVTAGSVLFEDQTQKNLNKIRFESSLHLPVSIRSHRCEVSKRTGRLQNLSNKIA